MNSKIYSPRSIQRACKKNLMMSRRRNEKTDSVNFGSLPPRSLVEYVRECFESHSGEKI